MTKFLNLKITITKDQPLDEVVRELERLGYKSCGIYYGYEDYAITYDSGFYTFRLNSGGEDECTLAELKEM